MRRDDNEVMLTVPRRRETLGETYDRAFFEQHRALLPVYRTFARQVTDLLRDPGACTVVDVGCGNGLLVECLRAQGVAGAYGIDGSESAREFWPREQSTSYQVVDLADRSRPAPLPPTSLVASFETAEHLPEASADHFVATLLQHSPGLVLFGAATVYQDLGRNPTHVNEQPFGYWIRRFEGRGYDLDVATTVTLKNRMFESIDVFARAWWYPKNVLAFVPRDRLGEAVHKIPPSVPESVRWFTNISDPVLDAVFQRDRFEYLYHVERRRRATTGPRAEVSLDSIETGETRDQSEGPEHDTVRGLIREATGLLKSGRVDDAEDRARRAVKADPTSAVAHRMLGECRQWQGDNRGAAEILERALALDDRDPVVHNLHGAALRGLGKRDAALSAFRRALELDAKFVLAINNIGAVHVDRGELDAAVACCQRAIELAPPHAAAHRNLGVTRQRQGRLPEALRAMQDAVALAPNSADMHYYLGQVLRSMRRFADAAIALRRSIELGPVPIDAHVYLGQALNEGGDLDGADAAYEAALALDPRHAGALIGRGNLSRERGRMEVAASFYARAGASDPDNVVARWNACIAELHVHYDDEVSVERQRERYRAALLELRSKLLDRDAGRIGEGARALGGTQPFYLPYQGRNDRELQALYGDLACRLQAAAYPQWASRPSVPRPASGERVRVGIVSGFFNHHSNWKIPIRGWVEHLNRERFELIGFYTQSVEDEMTADARRMFDRFVERQPTFESSCEAVRSHRPHLLIYPETGMDPMAVRLAALRLAPIQCVSWGHPVTSGLPTVDYFLSSELMEPPDGEEHYTETLVRLPNLSIHYTPPAVDPAPIGRSELGLRDDAVVFFCAQSIFKLLPRHDEIFTRIAHAVPGSQLLFLGSTKSARITARFRERLCRALADRGLSPERVLAIAPHLPPAKFQAAIRMSDVFLDSLDWSGCNSTLEALDLGLPVVTVPGGLMRGRHSAAILTRMGVTETIVDGADEMVALAAALGNDAGRRRSLAGRILERRERAYRDLDCVAGLESFILSAVHRTVESGSGPARDQAAQGGAAGRVAPE